MAKANMKIHLAASAEQVWKVVTDNKHYGWRSDLSRIEEMGDGKTFVEYTKSGFPTTFTITKRYRFVSMNLTWKMKI
ncbi:MAG: SRPBCC family protein [Blautia marasmi]